MGIATQVAKVAGRAAVKGAGGLWSRTPSLAKRAAGIGAAIAVADVVIEPQITNKPSFTATATGKALGLTAGGVQGSTAKGFADGIAVGFGLNPDKGGTWVLAVGALLLLVLVTRR